MIDPVNLLLLPPGLGDILHHLPTRFGVLAKRFLDDESAGQYLALALIAIARGFVVLRQLLS